MLLTKTLEGFDYWTASLIKRREVLKTLLSNEKISADTFNILDKKLTDVERALINLRETIDCDRSFWDSIASDGEKILESLLVDLRFLNLMGEMNVDKWLSLSRVIELGLSALKYPDRKFFQKNAGKISASNFRATQTQKRGKHFLRRREGTSDERRQILEKTAIPEGINLSSDTHCMNPWKPDCRRTDIKLSIYYNGQFLPICHECWKEISEKNIEWTT
ncbi:MAG: hypothetical protein QXK89_04115 [Candidatus Bathyarchaeia archaeon]|nr:hypothetical protein [Candidatus Bathyarchaeota archaeon]